MDYYIGELNTWAIERFPVVSVLFSQNDVHAAWEVPTVDGEGFTNERELYWWLVDEVHKQMRAADVTLALKYSDIAEIRAVSEATGQTWHELVVLSPWWKDRMAERWCGEDENHIDFGHSRVFFPQYEKRYDTTKKQTVYRFTGLEKMSGVEYLVYVVGRKAHHSNNGDSYKAGRNGYQAKFASIPDEKPFDYVRPWIERKYPLDLPSDWYEDRHRWTSDTWSSTAQSSDAIDQDGEKMYSAGRDAILLNNTGCVANWVKEEDRKARWAWIKWLVDSDDPELIKEFLRPGWTLCPRCGEAFNKERWPRIHCPDCLGHPEPSVMWDLDRDEAEHYLPDWYITEEDDYEEVEDE